MTQTIAYHSSANQQRAPLPSRKQRFSSSVSLCLDPEDSAKRQALETAIADKFEHEYGAQIHEFLPFLLSLSEGDQLGAVLGLRPARQAALFLEQYLTRPVEQAISQAYWTPVDRNQVVEIGNLAAAAPGSACALFAILASVLDRAGVRWVVCTATPQVKAMLEKMGFPSRKIGIADPECLGDQANRWGNYYASHPQIIVGDTRLAAQTLASNPSMAALTEGLAKPIADIAASLRLLVK